MVITTAEKETEISVLSEMLPETDRFEVIDPKSVLLPCVKGRVNSMEFARQRRSFREKS
jgi:hypothetical protein